MTRVKNRKNCRRRKIKQARKVYKANVSLGGIEKDGKRKSVEIENSK